VLPRRHVLDVWEFTKKKSDLLLMSTGTLAIDAIKYIGGDPKKDHLVDALDFNEFIVYMHPAMRPHNRALLFHVISDLLGLLLYGVPRKRKTSIESLEIIDYSTANVSYPVISVWNHLKEKVKTKKPTAGTIVDGFIDKIRIETHILRRYPFVDEILDGSRQVLDRWLPALSEFYEIEPGDIRATYDEWCGHWLSNSDQQAVVNGMVEMLAVQAQRDLGVVIDKEKVKASVLGEQQANAEQNDVFSRWYREGVDLLFEI
jgi:hypothetical protein